MQPVPVTLRCPRCGQWLAALPPPGAGLYWTHCPACFYPVPVIHPRDPPPLFSWEAYPHLTPRVSVPWSGGPWAGKLLNILLAISLGILVLLVGFLLGTGASAFPAHHYTVSGTIVERSLASLGYLPVSGATVRVTGGNGYSSTTTSSLNGSFLVANVPSGGIVLNVTAPGYAPEQFDLFDSPIYSAPGSGTVGINVTLARGTASDGILFVESSFPSLEALVATLWAGAVILGVGTILVAVALRLGWRGERPAWGVAAGATALLAPVAVFELSLAEVVPLTLLLSLLLGAIGAFTLLIATVRLSLASSPQPPSVDGL